MEIFGLKYNVIALLLWTDQNGLMNMAWSSLTFTTIKNTYSLWVPRAVFICFKRYDKKSKPPPYGGEVYKINFIRHASYNRSYKSRMLPKKVAKCDFRLHLFVVKYPIIIIQLRIYVIIRSKRKKSAIDN